MLWEVIPCGKRVFTHTHALLELNCLSAFSIFTIKEKLFVLIENLNSLLYLCFSFEMLSDCVISGLYHACSDTDLRKFDL